MSKVHTFAKNSKKSLTQSNKAHSLDTLAQLVTKSSKPFIDKAYKGVKISEAQRTLQARARSKA